VDKELIKQLADAGFQMTEDFDYMPPLEQLIEACGDSFTALIKKGDRWLAGGGLDHGEYYSYQAWGDTRIEAVACLYIALNGNPPTEKSS
jgi:hypothetical protein